MSQYGALARLAAGIALSVPLVAGCNPSKPESSRSFRRRVETTLRERRQEEDVGASGGRGDRRRSPNVPADDGSVSAAARRIAEKQQQVSSDLDAIQQHLDDLETELKHLAGAARASDWPKRIEKLKQRLAEARKQAEQRKAKTGKAWRDLTATLDQTVAELNSATKSMRQLVKSAQEPAGGQTGGQTSD